MADSTIMVVGELEQCYASIVHKDQNGAPYTPTAVAWRLWNTTTDAELQTWTTIPTPGPINVATIPGALNALTGTNPNEGRAVIFRVTLGSLVIGYPDFVYQVQKVPGVP